MTIYFSGLNSIYHICNDLMGSNKRMIRNVCRWTLLLIFAQVGAQTVSISPYSAYGYGDKEFNNGAANFGMANISTAYLSPFGTETNFMNPAANQNLRLTNFIFEGTMDMTNFKSEADDFSRSTTYLSRVSLGFPLGTKWRAGIGFQPFSGMGYDVGIYDTSGDIATQNNFEGSGGLNALQFMTSYNINKDLSIGLRADYLFGTLNKTQQFYSEGAQLITSYDNETEIDGSKVTAGLMYKNQIDDSKYFTLGLTYGLGSNLSADQQYLVKTFQTLPTNYTDYNIDTIQYVSSDRKVRIPQNASLGVSYGENLKWNVAAQIDYEKSTAFDLIYDNDYSNDRFKAAVGGYYIPQFNSFRSYFARATYRGGVYYEKTPITIRGEDISDYGITFGIGLPVGKVTDPSELNIGVQLGQRGTTSNNLVKENYANVKLSFTLNDSWFQRRKYD